MGRSRHTAEVAPPRRGLYGKGLPEDKVDEVVLDEVMATEIPYDAPGPFTLRGVAAFLGETGGIDADKLAQYKVFKARSAENFLRVFRETRDRVAVRLRELRRARGK